MRVAGKRRPRRAVRGKPPVRYVTAGVLALAGLVFLLHPVVVNLRYDRAVAAEQQRFYERSRLAWAGPDPYVELWRFLTAENERLHRSGQASLVDAFSYQTPGVDLTAHGIDEGGFGFVAIPSLGVTLPIHLGANKENMRHGAVHLTQTSYPIGGDNTNAVIAAHRGGGPEMFRNINKIGIGDEIVITNPWGNLVYTVVGTRIIAPTDIDQVMIQEGRDLVTLVSCHPLGHNHQRYVVYAERAEPGNR